VFWVVISCTCALWIVFFSMCVLRCPIRHVCVLGCPFWVLEFARTSLPTRVCVLRCPTQHVCVLRYPFLACECDKVSFPACVHAWVSFSGTCVSLPAHCVLRSYPTRVCWVILSGTCVYWVVLMACNIQHGVCCPVCPNFPSPVDLFVTQNILYYLSHIAVVE